MTTFEAAEARRKSRPKQPMSRKIRKLPVAGAEAAVLEPVHDLSRVVQTLRMRTKTYPSDMSR
ncbi:hypothetical protein, partial [Xanthomonas theicola]|uniref:hypothetical protein n=1 Tax=Xanthomonas theicola TaxID=56464 RepID=UPI001B7FF445